MGLYYEKAPQVYINRDNFEIYNTKPENVQTFEADEQIAETIALLNKKGYLTTNCCEGHDATEKFKNYFLNIEVFNELADTFNPENGKTILAGSDDIVYLIKITTALSCGITFVSGTKLPTIPYGFYIKTCWDGQVRIDAPIFTFTVKDNVPARYSGYYISNYIEEVNNRLRQWAESLEPVKMIKF